MGSYNVSFDMSTDMNYEIQTAEPMQYPFATVYPLLIKTNETTGASITVTEYKELQDSTVEMNAQNTRLQMLALRGINATAPTEQIIDDNKGFVISGMPFPGVNLPQKTFYQALYWLDSKDCSECGPVSVGTISVGISSTYPEDVVMNLINSLNVVKGEVAATAGQDMPPAQN